MLIEGNVNSERFEILTDKCACLLNSDINSDEILVLVQNSYKKNKFIERLKEKLKIDALSNLNVYTFFGLCYNSVKKYWSLIENSIKDENNILIEPNLSGLEISQYILKQCINKIEFRGYNSKVNLLHQILRRNSLITLNALDDDEIKQKTKVLKESFTSDIKNAINLYKYKTLELRAFDYLRQINLFTYIYKNTKNPYKYVFVDDADELTPVCFEYLKFLKSSYTKFFIGYDGSGSSRKGYLSAYDADFSEFLNEKPNKIDNECKKNENAKNIFDSVKKGESFILDEARFKNFIRADEMTDDITDFVNSLLSLPSGKIKPSDIVIVCPLINEFIKSGLKKINAPLFYLSGNEKLSDNKTVRIYLEALKLINKNTKNEKISAYVLKGILKGVIDCDIESVIKISLDFESDPMEYNIFKTLSKYENNENIKKFLNTTEDISDKKLSEQLYVLCETYLKKDIKYKKDFEKINQLLKQITDFEDVYKGEISNLELLYQIENTITSENPSLSAQIDDNSIIISTPQKIIDMSYKSKCMILYDTTGSYWTKQDTGPLYNAWVFQKSWSKKTYELEDNINLSLDKTARMLRKLYLLNEGDIYLYSSVYDYLGVENFKGINHFFKYKNVNDEKKEFKIIPRKDQLPVLMYKSGRMAVNAVAGAGKTTVMLALIMKLLNEGFDASNIFVLTFMESAARNFKERIKDNFPNLIELPHISTIHGLALRILKENNNHSYLGLEENFEISDESAKTKILSEILYNAGVPLDKTELYDRAISTYKNQNVSNNDYLKPLFKSILNEYQKTLMNNNMIDYDDLLLCALKILKTNKGIREYYQNLAKFVIEDEAQDSSSIQQELISIIGAKNGNVIRTGDINQAITSTFSNADTKGFRNFIEKYDSVLMNYSNRNATGIIKLANKTVKYGINISCDSFYDVETKPVEGKNIIDPGAVEYNIFENERDEKKFVLDKLKIIFNENKNANAAILLRSNKSVEIWASYIKENTPLNVITKSDVLNNNPVFRTIINILNFMNNPCSNKIIKEIAKNLMDIGFYKSDYEIFNYIDKLNKPIILADGEYFTLWWDLRYFINLCTLNIYALCYEIGEFYFSADKNLKSNIAMVCALILKVYNTYGNFEDTISKLNDIKNKPYKGCFNFFEECKKDNQNNIHILTMHKSKGAEYDFVFIPELSDDNIGLSVDSVKLKESSRFSESAKLFAKSDNELKKEIVNENFRLIYVAFTRAKKKLYTSCANEYKFYNKLKKVKPSVIFKVIKDEI